MDSVFISYYCKTFLKRPLPKIPKIGFQDQLLLNEGRKYCGMLPLEHSVILLTCIKLPFVIKICVLSIFECSLKTGFTVLYTTYFGWAFLFGAIGGMNKNHQNMRQRNTVSIIQFYTISNKWKHILSMLATVMINQRFKGRV